MKRQRSDEHDMPTPYCSSTSDGCDANLNEEAPVPNSPVERDMLALRNPFISDDGDVGLDGETSTQHSPVERDMPTLRRPLPLTVAMSGSIRRCRSDILQLRIW